MFEVAGQQAVGGDDDLAFGVGLEQRVVAEALRAVGAVVDRDVELRGEAGGLLAPVAHHAQRTHHEVRAWSFEQVGEGGRRLAEAHVVGEAAAEAELGEELQPRQRSPLIVAQLADELGGLAGLVEAFVGQSGKQVADPVGVGRGRLVEAVAQRDQRCGSVAVCVVGIATEALVVGQAQQLERGDDGLRGLEFVELGAFAAQLVGVDAHPAVTGVQQRGTCLLGAGDLGLGDLLVADHHLPLDECFGAELLLAVVGGRRRGFTVDAHAGADQSFRADQFDPHPLQLDGSDVEEVLGDVEFEFDLRRFVFEREVGEARDGLDLLGGGADELAEAIEVLGPLRDFDRSVVGVPHVVGAAPASAVAVVDEFEAHDPRIERVVGDHETDPRNHDRFAGEATLMSIEVVAQVLERVVEVVCASAHDVVGFGERSERRPEGLDLGLALAAEVGLPAVLKQERSGDAIDQLRVDRRRFDTRAGGADRRHRRAERGDGRLDRLGRHRLPPGDGERALVHDHRGDASGRHGATGEFGDPREPGERVREELGLR